jgi:outer membrane protein assembly factor BamB
MKRVVEIGTALFSVVAVAGLLGGCSGGSGPGFEPQQQNTAPPVSEPLSLPVPAELARLEELPIPEGADPAVFAALKTELASMLRARGDDRIVSAPPMLPGSSAYLSWDSDLSTLNWGYKCTGDYNQDSLVGVNDITPLGQNYLAEVPGDPNSLLAVVDGNGDGLITVNDITQIGQNYGVRVMAYNVYSSSALSDYPTEPAAGNGGAALVGSVPFPEGPPPAGERRRFEFAVTDPQPETYFWVRPTDGTSEGTPSNCYYLSAPANQPPVAVLTADPLLGDIPMVVQFDASASSDPDGEIVKYEWDWDGMQNGWEWHDSGATATVEHTFEEIAEYSTVVRVTDNEGALDLASVQIMATAPGNDPPVAMLVADPISGNAPLMVSFDASGSFDVDGEIVKYEWDWDGDGEFSAEEHTGDTPTASHEYDAGSYTAWVQVTDELDGEATASISLSVAVPPPIWAQFGHDAQHTHRSPYVGAQTNNVKWTFTTGDSVKNSPTIGADGTVYISSLDNKLFALNPDGSLKWSLNGVPDAGLSGPTIGTDGTLYIATGNPSRNVYALDPGGNLVWTSADGPGAGGDSLTVGMDGTLYVRGLADGRAALYAINPDGSVMWTWRDPDHINDLTLTGCAAIGPDGTIYHSRRQRVSAINPDGSDKWTYYAGGQAIDNSPAIGADGTIYIGGSGTKTLSAFNPNGIVKWSHTMPRGVSSSPAIGADGTVYVTTKGAESEDHLFAISSNNSLQWSFAMEGPVNSSPAIGADGTLYLGGGNNVYAVNADGSLNWSYTTGGVVRCSPAIGADGTVYVGSDDNKLYAFGP